MNISGIRPYAGFYDYNSIKATQLRSQQIAAAQEEQSVEEVTSPAEDVKSDVVLSPAVEQNYTAYDYAQNYNPDATYELKGVDSDIARLDVMKAISDLDKDQVLQQYQYFVGNQNGAVARTQMESQNPSLRSGENFSL
jgi:hypothetical protein